MSGTDDGLSDDERWMRESGDWPKSYKVFRSSIPFLIHATSEEEALTRLKQFREFLNHLGYFGDEGDRHESMAYVLPEELWTPQDTSDLEPVNEVSFQDPSELRPSMAGDYLYEWTWLRPERTGDYDPEGIARKVFRQGNDED